METIVFVIDIEETDEETLSKIMDYGKIKNKNKFMDEAEKQGTTYTLEGFQDAFNNEQISDVCNYIYIRKGE